ncbi:hypothetical protein AbraCBS73388_009337 [Aspergillus brasiliensis]|uniref:Uncharacterized protein n=1 Tax=Aspergillus brasiliensis TaxID=319629 RepID=A0A9W6DPJ0_9EURO|nr:hypothetical protein AbraCBS73388_009337 [Aspergillus brasiliensis]
MEDFGEELIELPEYQVIHDLARNPDVSPTEAVQRLLQIREDLHQGQQEPLSEIDGNHTWNTMFLMVEFVNLTPAAQQRNLIDFIIQLQHVDEDPQKEYPPSDLQEWENRNAFMAQITAKADHLRHPMDVSLYALYSCRSAFEIDQLIEEAVRTACIWYIYAGQRVWENCQIKRVYGDDDDPPPRRRFNMKKWRLWKDGLKAAQREFPRESTQEMLRKALEEVEKAEAESGE